MQWIKTSEAAELARVNQQTIYRWIQKGAIRASRVTPRSRILVALDDVDPASNSIIHHETLNERLKQ